MRRKKRGEEKRDLMVCARSVVQAAGNGNQCSCSLIPPFETDAVYNPKP